jgi:head-tail adaptor
VLGILPSAGSLRERVRIERSMATPDFLGGVQTSKWRAIVTGVPAQITPTTRGAEMVVAQGLQATATFEVWLRSSTETLAITEADRLVDERTGRVFNIRMITNPDERGRYLRVVAERGVAP